MLDVVKMFFNKDPAVTSCLMLKRRWVSHPGREAVPARGVDPADLMHLEDAQLRKLYIILNS